jgi:hypothetical protein
VRDHDQDEADGDDDAAVGRDRQHDEEGAGRADDDRDPADAAAVEADTLQSGFRRTVAQGRAAVTRSMRIVVLASTPA